MPNVNVPPFLCPPRRALALALASVSLLTAASLGCRAQEPEKLSLREQFRRDLMTDRRPAPLNPQRVSEAPLGELLQEKVRITTETGQDAVVLIHRPKAEGKYPTVIVQHFLGGSKDHVGLAVLYSTLANRGFLVAAIDGRYRGERQNGMSLDAAMVQALRTGKGRPFLLDTAYDLTRLVEYLQSRPDVDAERIGMTGISEGGILTWMTAAVDDRIKVAVPIIGVTHFGEALAMTEGPDIPARVRLFEPVLREFAKDQGQTEIDAKLLRAAWNKLVPGMLDRYDAPNMLPELAPRPLLIMNHELDELFPVAGAKKAYEATRARYAALKVEDRVDFRIAPGLKHSPSNLFQFFGEINGMAEWMGKWLKAPAKTAARPSGASAATLVSVPR
jgi:dienelactone hydrolase